MSDTVIHTHQLSKQFGTEMAVRELTFDLPHGSIFGFIGPSGCGKTTTVRLLTGLYQPTSGEAKVLGEDPNEFSRETRAEIGYMPQLFVLYKDLSVWENVNFAASLYGVGFRRGKLLNELLDFLELSAHKRKLVRQLSGGMRRRLSLAATLVHNPQLLFLDEPTTGIDPVLRRKLWDHFKSLQQEGRTLFVTTQYVGEAAYCDYVGVMAGGQLLMVETPEGLRQRAFGGELVDLRTVEYLPYTDLAQLRTLACVQGDIIRLSNNTVRIVVDEASTAMPLILDWCKDKNVQVESIEEHLPPFDDVFVELVEENGAHE